MATPPACYDPRRHVLASQLRRLGFLLCEWIPDEAFVRRCAVGLIDCERFNDGTATLGLAVLEPFVWTRRGDCDAEEHDCDMNKSGFVPRGGSGGYGRLKR